MVVEFDDILQMISEKNSVCVSYSIIGHIQTLLSVPKWRLHLNDNCLCCDLSLYSIILGTVRVFSVLSVSFEFDHCRLHRVFFSSSFLSMVVVSL